MDCLIFGLGNPGTQYENTRHNAGRMAVETFVSEHNDGEFDEWRHDARMNARRTVGTIRGQPSSAGGFGGAQRVLCILPETYMNRSGVSVRAAHDAYKDAEIIVVHDDLDLPLGKIKLSYDRGSGGHNGVQSVADTLGAHTFVRVRIGIAPRSFEALSEGGMHENGAPRKPAQPEKFVLQTFSGAERDTLLHVLTHTSEALEEIIVNGREVAMNRFN